VNEASRDKLKGLDLVEPYLCLSLGECFRMLSSVLGCELRKIYAVVAYVKESGVDILQTFLSRDVLNRSVVITGLDFHLTEPEALKKLIGLGVEVLVYIGDREFHPKFYVLECSNGHEYLIVGSANISRGAIMGENVEVNILASDINVVNKAKELIREIKKHSVNVKDIITEYEKKRSEILAKLDRHEATLLNAKLGLKTFVASQGKTEVSSEDVNMNSIAFSPRISKIEEALSKHFTVLSKPENKGGFIESRMEHERIRESAREWEPLKYKAPEDSIAVEHYSSNLEFVYKSKQNIEVDTFEVFHIDVEKAKTYVAQLLHWVINYGFAELPKGIGERKEINLQAKVYRPITNAYEALRHGPLQGEIMKCLYEVVGKQPSKKKEKAFWEALRLLLIVFRYGVKITKKQGEKGLALAREYDGAFKSRNRKNTFALKLTRCLKSLGLVEVSNNYVMPNLRKLTELGLYEIIEGTLRLIIIKEDDLTYRATFILLEPFKIPPRSYTLHKDDLTFR